MANWLRVLGEGGERLLRSDGVLGFEASGRHSVGRNAGQLRPLFELDILGEAGLNLNWSFEGCLGLLRDYGRLGSWPRSGFESLSRLRLRPGSSLESLGWLWPRWSSSYWSRLWPLLNWSWSCCLGLESRERRRTCLFERSLLDDELGRSSGRGW